MFLNKYVIIPYKTSKPPNPINLAMRTKVTEEDKAILGDSYTISLTISRQSSSNENTAI